MHRVKGENGEPLVATFEVGSGEGGPELILHSAGGSSGVGLVPRNRDYALGLEILLRRLRALNAEIVDAFVDSQRVQSLPLSSRRLAPHGRTYPIRLAEEPDLDQLRRAMTRAQGQIGRSADAKGAGGNERKRIRLCLSVPGFSSADHRRLAYALEADPGPDADPAPAAARGQGYTSDATTRRAIELHAMAAAKLHFEDEGWEVIDVSATRSYDLLCWKGAEELHVEVKGTTSGAAHVLLTPNEVAHAVANPNRVALFVLSGITLVGAGQDARAELGSATVFHPWMLDPTRLSPTGYAYTLDA